MTRFIDPESGRPYEVGPDGVPTWVDEPAPASAAGRPWYRRVRYVAPAAAVLGFAVAVASAGGAASTASPATGEGPRVTVTATTSTTATVTAAPTTRPATTVTRTITPRTVRVTVTRTATVRAVAGGGGGGTGGGAVYYANCGEARAAGAAPLYVGDPGYRPGLDRDGDGVACE